MDKRSSSINNKNLVIAENINKSLHLSLGTSMDGKPWVSEVHFAYDKDFNLYYRSLPTRRHSLEIAVNKNVAGNIVRQHSIDDAVMGLYFEGTAKVLLSSGERDTAYRALHKRLGINEDAISEANLPNGHQFYKIMVEKWYAFGKFTLAGFEKVSLN